MQYQKLLTLYRCTLLGFGVDTVSSIFAPNGGEYIHHGFQLLLRPWIMQDAISNIVDT
jgi:hypothetical protein